MHDPDRTPSGHGPIIDEVDLALGQVSSRLKEIAGSLRAGQVRFGGMSDVERHAFVRNAAARLRQVQHYAEFAACLFEEEFGYEFLARPRQIAPVTPSQLQAIPPQRGRLLRATKLLGAIAAAAGALAGFWKAIFGSRTPGE